MKRALLAMGLTMFIVLLAGVVNAEPRRSAQQQLDTWVDVGLSKEKFGNNTTPDGEISFEVQGPGIESMSLRHPSFGQPVLLMPGNPAGINQMELERSDLWITLISLLPDGYYEVILRQSGRNVAFPFWMERTTSMPEMPSITYPAHGQTISTTTPTITWNPVSTNVDFIYFELEAADTELSLELPVNSTSFTVPAGILVPGGTYEVCVQTGSAGNGIYYESSRCIEFTVTP